MSEPTTPEDVGEPLTDEEEFSIAVEPVVFLATPLLDTFFGERCSEFEPECECCKRWAAFDVLVQNPFVDRCDGVAVDGKKCELPDVWPLDSDVHKTP